jgi:hypothetical protein
MDKPAPRIGPAIALMLTALLSACGNSESPGGPPLPGGPIGARSAVFADQTMSADAIPCTADGVRVCIGDMNNGPDGADIRFRSFDGIPLFVIVTLPPAPVSGVDGDYPLVVQSHGWGAPPTSPDDTQYGGPTALEWARDGYAVIQFAARGWGNSCGALASRLVNPAACLEGYVRIDDYRREIRDVQHAVGLLVDEGVVDPERIGANGESYGAGASLALATLKNRVMDLDGSLKPWTSPNGTPISLAAAAPFAGWSDFAYAMRPNGRTLDSAITSVTANITPAGIQKLSINAGLYLVGTQSAYIAPPGINPDADLTKWFGQASLGEPYDTALDQASAEQLTKYRSPYYLLAGAYGFEQVEPAPLFLANGFTDDVFAADEYVRYYNLHRSLYPETPISLLFFDGGHQRGNNKAVDAENVRLAGRIKAFFDHYVKRTGPRPARDVTAFAQTCPADVPSLGPFTADTWEALHPGEVSFRSEATQTILSVGGNPAVALAFDPVAGGLACTTASAAVEPGIASYDLPTPTGSGYTLLGAPVVSADLAVTGLFGYIAARLVDVDPATNTKTLVARSLYRIDPQAPNGRQQFQLYANGWHFAPGHIPRLELLGRDAPYARPSNGIFAISVANLELRLPVHEVPGAEGTPVEVGLPGQ